MNTFVFMCVGDTTQAEMLTRSVKLTDPDAVIIQVSDHKTSRVTGTSAIHRWDIPEQNLMTFRLFAFSELKLMRPAVYLDTDMLMQRAICVEQLLNDKDAVLCSRYFGKSDYINTSYLGLDLSEYEAKTFGEIYPFVACFTITKSYIFWSRCYDVLNTLDAKFHKWYGDQEALRIVYAERIFNIGTVCESEVACLPEQSELRRKASFLHYKGKARKSLMSKDDEKLHARN